jgi:hypothetical protein
MEVVLRTGWVVISVTALLAVSQASAGEHVPATSPSDGIVIGDVLCRESFKDALENWSAELQQGGKVQARDGEFEIDVPSGCTVWYRRLMEGPILIEYEAKVISAGGANDRVSDLNCFWMARDSRSPDDLFATQRSGKFEDYNRLRCYYVGIGGNGNTTTRFRRYIGDEKIRPLLPEHDLGDKADLLTPNTWQRIRLVALGKRIEFYRDDRRLFQMNDAEPYTSGWFGLRTVKNHMLIRNFVIYRIKEQQ